MGDTQQTIIVDHVAHIMFPIDQTPKGVKTFTIDLDECELYISGGKTKNGKVVQFMTFKLPK